jgi:hypothetical protein
VPKLSDNQIGDRLYAALEAIGTNEGETIRGNTALVAARQRLSLLEQGLLIAAERNSVDVSVLMNQPIVRRPNKRRMREIVVPIGRGWQRWRRATPERDSAALWRVRSAWPLTALPSRARRSDLPRDACELGRRMSSSHRADA